MRLRVGRFACGRERQRCWSCRWAHRERSKPADQILNPHVQRVSRFARLNHFPPGRSVLWFGAMLVATLPTLMGGDLNAGKQALERDDYLGAMREFRPLAEQGIAEAELEVGFLYWFGQGLPKDKNEAEKWFTRATSAVPNWRQQAEHGDTQAALRLGMLSWANAATPADSASARLLISRAAEQGDPTAQMNLAAFYLRGELFEKNEKEAARWYSTAAEKNCPAAEAMLGYLYREGRGVPQDLTQAEIWLRRGIQHGSLGAYTLLGDMYRDGRGVGKTPAEALRLYRVAAEKGFALAMRDVGDLLARGEGTPRDMGQAAQWYTRAAEQGDPRSQVRIGNLYTSGRGVPQNDNEALKWYRLAADQRAPEAYYMLGWSYQNGRGVPQSYDEGLHWSQKAADAKYPYAWSALATIYGEGWGVAQDIARAIDLLTKAASGGVAEAQYRLSAIYRDGDLVKRDIAIANDLLKKAAQQGYEAAEDKLGFMLVSGQGLARDLAEGMNWLRKAADAGYAASQYNLGYLFANVTEPRNPIAAANWIRKSADQGYPRAEHLLGLLYRDGIGVPKDYVQAYMWLNLAAATGDDVAVNRRNDLERLMTPERIAEAQDLTARWKPKPTSAEMSEDSGPDHVPTFTQPKLASTGTGFFVTKEGHAVTNSHVVNGCTTLTANRDGSRLALLLVAQDQKTDLALLKLSDSGTFYGTFRAGRGPGLGEPILTAGYPLRGLLASTLNVSSGNISALAGIADDASRFQITAPVQPGNSGGPLFDQAGNVVGVVVEKLNALNVAKWTGDIPQNVNFAIKGTIVQAFLDANGIRYSTAPSQTKLNSTDISQRASKFTIVVECWK